MGSGVRGVHLSGLGELLHRFTESAETGLRCAQVQMGDRPRLKTQAFGVVGQGVVRAAQLAKDIAKIVQQLR